MKAPNTKISKVLVANRGEIALRIKRACEAMGIAAVGVASDIDRGSFFAKSFNEIINIGGSSAHESYLNGEKLIRAALDSGCNALHPGYGFLSENASFAARVREAGLIFIGPSAESIELLGDKTKARERVQKFNVPCVPGCSGGLSDAQIISAADSIGYPVIIKASGGGGGRGMRIAHAKGDLVELLPRARGEAKKNFGNDDVFIERYVLNPRHVEVQIMGDIHGNVLHFGTRDCTAQRRHQKLIEEAPAPNLSSSLRERIHEAAVNAGKSVGYYNAGTCEFLVSGDEFYFLEMNTRIQVEHPVTEEITGIDLVQLQISVAEGQRIPILQKDIEFNGHAIEFRICAEDPERNFAPATGKITALRWKTKPPWVREETGFQSGDTISPYYDGMISKIIVTANTRQEAIQRGYEALQNLEITGIANNVEFHRWLILQREFRKVQHSIQYVENTFSASSLGTLREREKRDQRHRKPIGEAEFVERFTFCNQGKGFDIDVVHLRDGTFLAVPLSNGKIADVSEWKRSNCLEAILDLSLYSHLAPEK